MCIYICKHTYIYIYIYIYILFRESLQDAKTPNLQDFNAQTERCSTGVLVLVTQGLHKKKSVIHTMKFEGFVRILRFTFAPYESLKLIA